jgi:hypothetical protein
MQLTRERPRAPQRGGLFRRILLGEGSGGAIAFRDGPSDYLDLRAAAELGETHERIERLELGMRLIVEAMKRSYGRLAASIEQLGSRTLVGTTVADVQRVVADALQPVAASLGEVAETLRTIPYLVAAAADHVTDRVEAARAPEGGDMVPAAAQPSEQTGVLPVTPFELEPVEKGFDTLTALRRARFAVDEMEDAGERAAS